jgi:hypothetical protein
MIFSDTDSTAAERQTDEARLSSVLASTARALRRYFEIDPKTETRFMWVDQRMFDLH